MAAETHAPGASAGIAPEPPPDPREQEEWFRALPPAAREDLRTRWRIDDGLARNRHERRRGTTRVYVLEAAGAFFLLELLLMGASPLSLLLALAFGAAAGGLCALLRATAFLSGLAFLTSFLVFGALAGSMHFFYYVIAGLIAFCVGLSLGRVHLLQRFDGSEL